MKEALVILGSVFLSSVVLPANGADISNGKRLYQLHCAGCHGPTGVNLIPAAPNFARGEGLMQPDLTLLNTIKSGKRAMPAFRGILKDQEILDVIAFSRTLRR